MTDFEKMKCKCCQCYDNFAGCGAFDCQYDFDISMPKVIEVAKEYGVSREWLIKHLLDEKAKHNNERMYAARDELGKHDCLPDNFDPETDTKFLISFVDAIDIGKKKLVDLNDDELMQLKSELDLVLKIRGELD